MEPIDNRSFLASLEEEFELLTKIYFTSTGGLITGIAGANPFLVASFFGANIYLLRRIEKLKRIINVVTNLVDKFSSEELMLFPRLDVPGYNPLDLLVYFPSRAFLVISIRSMGDSTLTYREEKETLFVRRSNHRGVKKWHPDPLVELSAYQSWLIKNREQFELSSKQVRAIPVAKVLIISGETRIHQHQPHLYTMIGGSEYLAISRKGTAFVIKEEVLNSFTEDYLTHLQNKKQEPANKS